MTTISKRRGNRGKFGVTDGARTRDNQNHNLSFTLSKNKSLTEICGIFGRILGLKIQGLAGTRFAIFGKGVRHA